ncbi:helix-turn-helix domain-containing protein [Aquimarina latercula]|uniref:helix-turn-helix domain-containing protein n=1 Tax=Aquimarina latercula TaxID=987 RepID=UPI000406A94B|nr:helix-turn-helix domain-containing protein [Aquimarina latercula]
MKNHIVNVNSISELHEAFGFEKPKHPLITLINTEKLDVPTSQIGTKVVTDLYMIALKDRDCGVEYGRNHFDFAEGVMVFSAPKQVSTVEKEMKPGDIKGWMLYFHPDLIRGTHLGEIISDYSFFNYGVFEALHLSEDEEITLKETVKNIENEFTQRIDNHSQRVIVSNLELVLNYCLRFYERQFNTRAAQNKDVFTLFEKELKMYFKNNEQLENSLPSIDFFAQKANLSSHYFSDVLKKETGRSAKDHINEYVIELAKNKLLATNQSISEIAFELGFNYPHYFTRLFKSKTGNTPLEYRKLN